LGIERMLNNGSAKRTDFFPDDPEARLQQTTARTKQINNITINANLFIYI